MSLPLVSIGLPLYNEEKHLHGVLDSLLAQTYAGIEVVISDNASTDATGEICREYASRDARIRYHRQPNNLGSSANFNRTLELSRGEYFHWASGHDIHPPGLIEKCIEVLRADPEIALCYVPVLWERDGDASGFVDTRGERSPFARLGIVLWGANGGAVYGVYRTALLRRTLLIERVVASDILLLAELAVLGTFARIPGPVLVMHQAKDYGDWGVYVKKIFGEIRPHPHRLFRHALVRLCHRVGRHFSVRGKVQAYIISMSSFWARFWWMREGLPSLSRLPSASPENSSAPGLTEKG